MPASRIEAYIASSDSRIDCIGHNAVLITICLEELFENKVTNSKINTVIYRTKNKMNKKDLPT